MQECPRCGDTAAPDPEHANTLWCLTCWLVWTLPHDSLCNGSLPRFAPALRVLRESRGLNR
ncbi:hypothetical protein GCM10010387_00110 [Streptomyces inusitatus]|uniref:Uncharacterized protein n=1 Tax=Streptomyces inusitatus TaxID=68221 RepID=A0A918PJD3_9ACTN|nr:hypothetical protein GCM10010387_00110 [Streptomyces inusitatus]